MELPPVHDMPQWKRQGIITYDSLNKRGISSSGQRKVRREGDSGFVEERSGSHCYLSMSTRTHPAPSQATVLCPLSAGGEVVLRWQYDSSYCVPVLRWILYNRLAKQRQPVALQGCQRAPASACIGRADVTFSRPSPCWSLLLSWHRR